MPKFLYRAKDGPARTVEGEVEAESLAMALARIDGMGLSPVTVREKPLANSRGRKVRPGRIPHRDVSVFTRQLASLTKSGVPILKALTTIADQTENESLQVVIRDLEHTIRDGNMLSAALARYPVLFPQLYVNMVHAGESSGLLDTSLFRLAEAREKDEDLRRKVQAALAYPLLIVGVGFGTVFVLLTFFMPRIIALFRDYRALPLPTRILIHASDFFSQRWYWILLLAGLLAAIVRRLVALQRGRLFVDTLKLRVPLLKDFWRKGDLARFARTLSLMLGAGVPIDRALALSAETLHNSVLRDEMMGVREQTVVQGRPLSYGLKYAPQIPIFVANMAAVGEESGRLDEALAEVAAYYEQEIDQQTRLATSLLEPILILVVGGLVGFIVLSLLLPIFQISSSL